ncbi:MAG TPA: PH domain-containing protein [Candidatus Saccharimonadales bacterium]|nr:PH domain-containing protein [Candidatus Saccharimonadales bacterium]
MQPNEPQQNFKNPLAVMQPGEQIVCEIKRHPIGLIGTYVMAGILIVLAAVLAALLPHYITNAGSLPAILWGAFALVTVVAVLIAWVGAKVYWGNRWIVTSDSLTQVAQTTLFNTQSSQLSMGNIEDVTAEQNGILAHMFGYGLLRVETAGERSKFVFMYCPSPNRYAQEILGARERFEQGRRGEDEQRLYRSEGAYAQPGTEGPAEPPVQAPQN